MKTITITTLEELGDFWLTWYVRRDRPGQLIRDIHRDHVIARSLCVREVIKDVAIHRALEEKTAYDADRGVWWSHIEGITWWRSRFEAGEPAGAIQAWWTAEGLLFEDGSHRSCALYELARQFELLVAVSPAPSPTERTDLLPELRRL
jgi:hypothetical protein